MGNRPARPVETPEERRERIDHAMGTAERALGIAGGFIGSLLPRGPPTEDDGEKTTADRP